MNALSVLTFLFLLPFSPSNPEGTRPDDKAVMWYSWEEAVEANKEEPRKFFVDVYTDWCGWCKRMDLSE